MAYTIGFFSFSLLWSNKYWCTLHATQLLSTNEQQNGNRFGGITWDKKKYVSHLAQMGECGKVIKAHLTITITWVPYTDKSWWISHIAHRARVLCRFPITKHSLWEMWIPYYKDCTFIRGIYTLKTDSFDRYSVIADIYRIRFLGIFDKNHSIALWYIWSMEFITRLFLLSPPHLRVWESLFSTWSTHNWSTVWAVC